MGRGRPKKEKKEVVDIATIINNPEALKDVLTKFKAVFSEKDEAKLHTETATELLNSIVEHYCVDKKILNDAFISWSDEKKAQVKAEGSVLADALKDLNSRGSNNS
jgi:hypothetical protein